MSPSAVRPAVRQGKSSAAASVATSVGMKCSPQYALNVARKPKCPLSLEEADQCIVVIATIRSEQAGGGNLAAIRQRRLG